MTTTFFFILIFLLFRCFADECKKGTFGNKCIKKCGKCLNITQCHQKNGTCLNGCKPGYQGRRCKRNCILNTYGMNCSMKCGRCKQKQDCNHITGICKKGCKKGFQGDKCNKECDLNTFGKKCTSNCGHCVNNETCNHIDGKCMNGCANGFQRPKCNTECPDGKYGQNCRANCSATCNSCNKKSGFCEYGCKPGWKGDNCETVCPDGFFGRNCVNRCNETCISCNKKSGVCDNGCKPGWEGNYCQNECQEGFFGQNCKQKCQESCNDCNKTSGACENGCKAGWKGIFCQIKCDDWLFGENCAKFCGHCSGYKTCDHVTGICLNGCQPGYMGENCLKKCEPGLFGVNCSSGCGHCLNNKSCHFETGVCFEGCEPGYRGNNCKEKCDDGLFGINCSTPCGHCFDNKTCHHINGSCIKGCDVGYRGIKCTEGCPTGAFGRNCNKTCSINCKNRSICEKDTGHCIDGCAVGWKGDICNKKCDNNMFGENCEQKCGHCANSSTCNPLNGSCLTGCDLGFQGPLCNDECSNGTFGYNCMANCSSFCVDGICDIKSGACKKIEFRAGNRSDNKNNAPFIGIGAGFLVIIIAVVILVVVKRSRRSKTKPKKKTSEKSQCGSEMKITGQANGLKMDNKGETAPVYDGFNSIIPTDSNYSNININTTLDIPIEKLEIVITEKRKNDNEGFRKEYAALSSGELHSCEFGKKPENVPKNRYKTTFPYDHSRVVLDIQSSELSDYINANYIEGANRQKEYIATQGPKSNTLGDFWRMIWQENVSSVVMVTTLVEGEKVKCNKYWPDKDNPVLYGPMQVTLMEEKEYACFTTRQLSVLHKKLKCTRVVTQYHYTAWPDHGVPEPLGLLTFHNHVINTSANNSQSPTIVHCSAGIGRTGTYIALDALFQTGKSTGKVNVAEFVAKMRQNRVSMIQTYEQYITVYLALNESFKAPIKADTMIEFLNKAEKARKNIPVNQNPLHDEFQLLLKIRQKYSKDDYNFAVYDSEDQLSGEILPLKKYGLYLSPNKTTLGNYINAIAVPSFTNLQHFIVTKYPLEEKTLDLLRLLSDHESDTVISMQPLSGIKSAKVWLPPVSSSIKIPPFTVHHRSESQTDVKTHEIQIVHDNAEVRTVIIVEPGVEIQCSGSSVDTSQLRSLVSTVLYLETKQPITILSSDGASLCGLFIAVHNVIQQMNMDDRVDVFTAVRQLQIRRPEFCSKFEDYELIYQAVMDHCQNASENIFYNQ
nr:receptor-type tyrosine-protein phosphatase alpha isoform X1 [Crassostrea gigas]